jgi:predicted N-acetyltransferase YhbS
MTIVIRNEKPEDYRKVEEVAREAFWNLYFPGCSEHLVIHKMRTHQDFMPELTFVIEVDGDIVGSIFYTRSKIVTEDGRVIPTISFGPVSILPSMHRKGLGRRLIEHSIQAAKAQGHLAIVTLGYPYHYEVHGFRGGKQYGVSMPDGKFYKGLLVLPLSEHALDQVSGYAVFAEVLDDQDPEEVEVFDRQFPPKKKAVQESQKEFEIACALLDE